MAELVTKRSSEWMDQAEEAIAVLQAANGGVMPQPISAAADVDYPAFVSLIEALVTLESITGRTVAQDLIDLAGLRRTVQGQVIL